MNDDERSKILIVDDSMINRAILSDIIEEKFSVLEAENGVEAMKLIREYGNKLSLILLDLVMPEMDGLEVLAAMNRFNLINEIPVIMISAENSSSYIERAYELGATDFINRPFNVYVVKKRIANTIMLYSKQKNLINLVSQQVYEKEKNSDLMVKILSHIVEFRNGESGLHIMHVNTITELVLKQLIKKTDKYKLTMSDIDCIVTASSLHDIGKISIPDEILNKPGKLTAEEFEVIKGHSEAGAKMLGFLTEYINDPLIIAAKDICLYHHEKYDGKGYPMGLKGDEIPISAQVVAIADVYDALVSERCYKKAIPHKEALKMICDGECGAFNPIVLECLCDIEATLENEIKVNSLSHNSVRKVRKITDELLSQSGISSESNSINYLEQARTMSEFLASMSKEIQFEYTKDSDVLTVSEWFAEKFKLPLVIVNPFKNEKVLDIINGLDNVEYFGDELKKTTPEEPAIEFTTQIKIEGQHRSHRVLCMAKWDTEGEAPRIVGAVGKLIDIENEYQIMADLKRQASLDPLTNIYNHRYCVNLVKNKLSENTSGNYALGLFDLDSFKSANDNFGHLFGDEVLKSVASTLQRTSRKKDIVARIGGDEFMVFIEYKTDNELKRAVESIHRTINDIKLDAYNVKISTGISTTKEVGYDYNTLFNCADTALYYSKSLRNGALSYYDKEMKLSGLKITPIEN